MHRMSAPPCQSEDRGFIERAPSGVALSPALIGDLRCSATGFRVRCPALPLRLRPARYALGSVGFFRAHRASACSIRDMSIVDCQALPSSAGLRLSTCTGSRSPNQSLEPTAGVWWFRSCLCAGPWLSLGVSQHETRHPICASSKPDGIWCCLVLGVPRFRILARAPIPDTAAGRRLPHASSHHSVDGLGRLYFHARYSHPRQSERIPVLSLLAGDFAVGACVRAGFVSYCGCDRWICEMTQMLANHALQRTRRGRRGCNRTPSWAGSLSLGRSATFGRL